MRNLSGKCFFSENDLAYHLYNKPINRRERRERKENINLLFLGDLCVLGGKCLFAAGTIASPSSKVVLRSKTPGDQP